jgi:hypothetical protein
MERPQKNHKEGLFPIITLKADDDEVILVKRGRLEEYLR